MTSKEPHQRLVIVLGGQSDPLCRQAVVWLRQKGWKVYYVDHIYSVSALLGRIKAERALVMGRPEVLVRCGKDLLRILEITGACACGVVSGEGRYAWPDVDKVQSYGLPVFMHAQALFVGLRSLAESEARSGQFDFLQVPYRTTEAELTALLGEDGTEGRPIDGNR